MILKIVHGVLRLLFVILVFSDFRYNYKLKKGNATLHREMSTNQKTQQYINYAGIVLGLAAPTNLPGCVITFLCIGYFFYYTDREIWLSNREFILRNKTYEIKRLKNYSYENHTLVFDYNNEHVEMKYPLLTDEIIAHEITDKYLKREASLEKRGKK